MSVYRVHVEKRSPYDVEAQGVMGDLQSALGLPGLVRVRLLNRYDLEHITPEDFERAKTNVLSEPQVDTLWDELPETGGCRLAVEYLPGQFDQRADSAAQCIQLMTCKERPLVKNARIYLLEGHLTPQEFEAVKRYLINPVESREAGFELPETLQEQYAQPDEVPVLEGFTALDREGLLRFLGEYGLAMDADDLAFCQGYFREEGRDPTLTEIRVIDTYWSDHCRHTTFHTRISQVEIDPPYVRDAYNRYTTLRACLYGDTTRPVTLMDLGTIGAKYLKKQGKLPDLDASEEINACSVRVSANTPAGPEDWLLMFKNETHNHPTEIEPFGGAATCLGGAIRDPLSGRSYVYQAMRLTGAADPTRPVGQTRPGKLPQRKIVTTAAAGYSSYGNQIGLATGQVHELYHPGYEAKRMEVGAVVGAAPAANVVRSRPAVGDVVLLLGGKTGRDGCGGATGSSKSHTVDSLATCGAEVQKGNAPEERKLQRLFRRGEATRLIKRCNDFGAGGVSVAIGELADSLLIELDRVPKKYEGLDGTELAISESQERMAVVVAREDAGAFARLAAEENLEATQVATVTDSGRLVMQWRGREIVSLSRSFLDTNGAPKHTRVHVTAPACEEAAPPALEAPSFKERLLALAGDLNVCSQKGLIERFDPSIGAGTVLLPLGGSTQSTPAQAMAAKLPVPGGKTTTASLMAWGFDPYLAQYSPFHGAVNAVVHSVAKIIAAGGSRKRCWLTFQEYFERLRDEPARWGKPFAALLGALQAQLELEVAAIGGKDSMSGSFEELDVPPTLISFAVSTAETGAVLSPEFKHPGSYIYLLAPELDENHLPRLASVRALFDQAEGLIAGGQVCAAWAVGFGGILEGLFKMALGNRIGVKLAPDVDLGGLSVKYYGALLLESPQPIEGLECLGRTIGDFALEMGGYRVALDEILPAYEGTLAGIYPCTLPTPRQALPTYRYEKGMAVAGPAIRTARPLVLIPAFPGTNCEYDTAAAFEKAGADTVTFVVRNRSAADIEWSVSEFEKLVRKANILAIPGGFSGGDEPDGSGKFITAFLRNPAIAQAVMQLLKQRDGLMLGICNGFQALIKLGLVPFGEICDPLPGGPTLTFNRIGRHQAKMVQTAVCSNLSPWLMYTKPGEVYTLPVSHGEGRFVADGALVAQMAQRGQIATQYVGPDGAPTLDTAYNPNGSLDAIEGITSPDGRVLGKMAHSERVGEDLYRNMPGRKDQQLFRAAVDYFAR